MDQVEQSDCCRNEPWPQVLEKPPTYLLHLVDAVSSPVIFGLLLRDKDTTQGFTLSLKPNPNLATLPPPEISPSYPSYFRGGRRQGKRDRRRGRN